jgi:hypothetical protein
VNESEAVAAYVGVIRYELKLPPGTDALAALQARLRPDDVKSRPPARAPGIVRLRKALQQLRKRTVPESTLEQLVEDLRFLALFEDDDKVWRRDALESLLTNVLATPTRSRKPTAPDAEPAPPAQSATIIPLRRKQPKEDA